MDTQQIDEKAVFNAARRIADAAARDDYLSQACGDDQPAIQRIRELLRIHEEEQSFLEPPAADLALTTDHSPIAERPGTVIGPYKLLQQIGEGGMGVVFMAEQTEPIQRTVALKIIKPGMDTRQVIARFEAERQALAMMDHPNIAKVLDAGTTDSGRPYFVMELVKGVPITKYCDDKHLPIRARLELFVQVCQAVQHAHQKGIIHRDIKPNNVLVAEYDNRAVPKVIDFGVAKATAQKLTERTMFTEFGQVLGTVEYMSPEQAKLNQLDIDTRSDIYSLGVLLYELVAGTTPFERKRLTDAAFDEMLRIIREEEPPKPSTKLSSSDTLPSIAANRHSEPARLSKEVHGELDWIVMKALEKDRARRYDSAANFAADIERHLHDEPVHAGPPSAVYRFRKFAKRNRTALATGALLALGMLVALGGIASGIWERRARQARVTGQLEVILEEVSRLEKDEKWSEALMTARRAEPALATGEAAPEIQERARQALADLELVRRLEDTRADSGTVWGTSTRTDTTRSELAVQAEQAYAAAFRDAGIDVDSLPVKEAAERITARDRISTAVLPALDDWVAVRSVGNDEAATRRLVGVLRMADPDPWRRQMRDALARKDWSTLQVLTTSTDLDEQPAATLGFLYAAIDMNQTQFPEWAENERELVLRRAQWKYPADFWINHRLGVHLIWRQGEHVEEGIGYMRAAVAVRPQSSHAMSNLGAGYTFLREFDQAIACYRKSLELRPDNWVCLGNLGISLSRKGAHEEAIAAFEEAIRLRPDLTTEAHAELSMIHSNRPDAHLRNARRAAELAAKAVELEPNFSNHWTALGIARYRESQWQEARTAFDKSLQLGTDFSHGVFSWEEAIDWFFLAMVHWQLGNHDEARKCYDEAVQWMDQNKLQNDVQNDEQLRRIRAEAEELLKISKTTE
ncbi:MAG: serine/threonine-protein kinase [Pirellulales bacterium]